MITNLFKGINDPEIKKKTTHDKPASKFRKALGIGLMGLGISGIFLPFLQGALLLTIGYLIYTNRDWRKVLKLIREKSRESKEKFKEKSIESKKKFKKQSKKLKRKSKQATKKIKKRTQKISKKAKKFKKEHQRNKK